MARMARMESFLIRVHSWTTNTTSIFRGYVHTFEEEEEIDLEAVQADIVKLESEIVGVRAKLGWLFKGNRSLES